MTLLEAEASVKATVPVRIVDADVHPTPRSHEELRAYLPEPWRSARQDGFAGPKIYVPWGTGMRHDAFPEEGPSGSDPDLLEHQLFNEAGVDIAMLLPMIRTYNNPKMGSAVAAATNLWMADTWLGTYNYHGRYRSALNVCPDDPAAAVREIEVWAGHEGFSSIRFNTYTDAAFGDERYHPIYETASKYNLPISVHFAKSAGVKMVSPVGFARNYWEFHAMIALNYAAQVTSLILQGTFAKFPRLRFVFIEGGFTWVLPLLWRLDNAWHHFKSEVPWVVRKPSAYLREHVRFTTQPIEEPRGVRDLLRTFDYVGAEDLLMFSTDYPHWDYDAPVQAAFNRMPAELHDQVFYKTAIQTYSLPTERDARPVGVAHAMEDELSLLGMRTPELGYTAEGAD